MKDLNLDLRRLQEQSLYRTRRVLAGPQEPLRIADGTSVLTFCSNDYLGLANHPAVVRALQQGAATYGAGSGAAHLVTGHSAAHHALEEELAAFTRRPRALLFSTGYMANLAVLSALAGHGDKIYQDRLNHASLIDGGLLSRARLVRFRHADAADLAARMEHDPAGEQVVVTDGVFSMDGDLAPLPELAEVCRVTRAWMMVDDAHGLGVIGANGGGCLEHFALGLDQVPILMGTLGKALGTFGAFVAGSEALIESLIQRARSYIYTTAPPPAIAEATRTSLRLLQQEDWRRDKLQTLIAQFRTGAAQLGLPLVNSATPIQPLIAGSAAQAMSWSRQLAADDILVTAIRPPTVPEGSARLRITFSALHTQDQVERLLAALSRLPRAAVA